MAMAKNKYEIIKVKTSDGRYIRKWRNVKTGKTYINKPPDAGTGVSRLGLTRGETKALKDRQAKGNLINKNRPKPDRRGNTNTGLGDIKKHQKKVSTFAKENRGVSEEERKQSLKTAKEHSKTGMSNIPPAEGYVNNPNYGKKTKINQQNESSTDKKNGSGNGNDKKKNDGPKQASKESPFLREALKMSK